MIFVVFIFIELTSFTDLPKGDFVQSFPSPNNKYTVKIYLVNGGATVDYAIRGEITPTTFH
nr:DUF5412 family protein [Paenibacillus frigoriresistens]